MNRNENNLEHLRKRNQFCISLEKPALGVAGVSVCVCMCGAAKICASDGTHEKVRKEKEKNKNTNMANGASDNT